MLGRLRTMLDVSNRRLVGAVSVGHGINEFFAIVIPPVLPLLVTEFDITVGQGGLLMTIFFVMYAIFQLPAGFLGDRIGKLRLMVVGLVGMTIGIAIASTAQSYGMLLVAQAIAGISGSTFHPAGMSAISDAESGTTEGRAMGVFGFGGTIGTMSAPLVVGGVAAVASWRAALGTAAILGGGATVLTIWFLYSHQTKLLGSVRTDGGTTASLNTGTARRLFRMLATKEVAVLCLITLLLSMQHRAIQTYTTAYVAADTGVAVSTGNIAFTALLAGGSIASLIAGDFADRIDRVTLGAVASVVTAGFVAGTLVFSPIAATFTHLVTVTLLICWFTVIGFMMYASYPVKNAIISESADQSYSGSLFGVVQTGSALGSASGPAVFGAVADRWGVIAAFPTIAVVGLGLAGLFVVYRFTVGN